MGWIQQKGTSIGMKACPRCKTPIMKCMRIMNTIKRDMKDVQTVKNQLFFKNQKDLNKQQVEHLKTAKALATNKNVTGICIKLIRKLLDLPS